MELMNGVSTHYSALDCESSYNTLPDYFELVSFKLRQLELRNQIVYDLKLDSSKLVIQICPIENPMTKLDL